MVKLFITEILGVDGNYNHVGINGDTAAYYGTVEQQGRLTLHIHMLVWLIGNLTPQEMRRQILDTESDWQKKLIVLQTQYGLLHYDYLIHRTGLVIFFQPT